MTRTVYPIWVFVLVAAGIALAAFGAAQLGQGWGVIVAAAGSTMWTAFVVRKGRTAGGSLG